MAKTYRKVIVKKDEVHYRDNLDDMRRGGAHKNKKRYTRKQKHKKGWKEVGK